MGGCLPPFPQRLSGDLVTQTRSRPAGRARPIASFQTVVILLIEFGSMPTAARFVRAQSSWGLARILIDSKFAAVVASSKPRVEAAERTFLSPLRPASPCCCSRGGQSSVSPVGAAVLGVSPLPQPGPTPAPFPGLGLILPRCWKVGAAGGGFAGGQGGARLSILGTKLGTRAILVSAPNTPGGRGRQRGTGKSL